MRILFIISFTSALLCCCSDYSRQNNHTTNFSDDAYSDDTIIYNGDTIVYAGYLKYCDTIAIDSIL